MSPLSPEMLRELARVCSGDASVADRDEAARLMALADELLDEAHRRELLECHPDAFEG